MKAIAFALCSFAISPALAAADVRHPLDPLTADEISTVADLPE